MIGLGARLADGRRPGLRPRSLGCLDRGPAPRHAGTPCPGDGSRPHRHRLADRRRPRHGVCARAAAAHRRGPVRGAGRRFRERRRFPHAAADHPRQGHRLHPVHAGGRAAGHSLGPPLHRPYRIARAVPPRRAGHCPGCRLRRRGPVRRVLCARRLLRRHGAGGIRAQPPGGGRIPAAARRLCGPVLRFGRHAVRSDHHYPQPTARYGHLRHHCGREIDRRLPPRPAVPAPDRDSPDHLGKPCPDR